MQCRMVRVIDPNGIYAILPLPRLAGENTRDAHPFSYNVERWFLKIEQPLLMSGHTHRPLVARNGVKNVCEPRRGRHSGDGDRHGEDGVLESDGAR